MKLHGFAMKVLVVFCLFSSAAFAQTATGSISGVVQDESAAVIPGVSVTVTNVDKGISSALVTDASGRYHAPSLIPGRYEIQAQTTGFETGVRRGLQVTVGSALEINMVLKVGQVTQQTVVTAEAPMVETATSSLSGLVEGETIRELPLNGRSFDQLIALQSSSPVFRSRGASDPTGNQTAYTVNGARTLANLFMMDGTELMTGGSMSQMPGGILGRNMGVDAVQEFTVLSGNYSAAYGKKGGGIINIATRSGTNQIHGTAFGYLRNSALDAKDFFAPRPQPPPFRRTNFGGALGGPIRKDSSFLFGNYEGLREGLTETSIAVVPDANAHQGFLPDSRNPGQLINVGVAPEIRPFLAAFYPVPNGRNFGDGSGEYISNPKTISIQDFFLARFDQRISDKDSFFARYNLSRASRSGPDRSVPFTFFVASKSFDQSVTLEEKRAYARTVNLLRFGFSRGNLLSGDSTALATLDPAMKFWEGAAGWGQIIFGGQTSGAAPISRAGGGGGGRDAATSLITNLFEVSDQVYHYRGPHSLQFGVQAQRLQHNSHYTPGSSVQLGQYQFDSLANLLAGRSFQFQGVAPGAFDPTKAYRLIYFSTFVQDDYKVLRNLTLNLGLRYELFTVPVEASGDRISNFHTEWVDGLRVVNPLPSLGSPFWQGNHKNFAPRIGFAWDPFRDGKLAVRGGFGMFYDQNDSDYHFFTLVNPPFYGNLSVSNPPFPRGFSGAAGTAPRPAPDVIDFFWRTATRLQYSFGLQRQITSSSVFNITYVGSHSYHLTRQVDFNAARPQFLPGGVVFYPQGAPRIQPALGSTRSITPDASGYYNSLQTDFIQRMRRGVRFKVSYTFAKSMDNAAKTVSVFASGEPTATMNPYDVKADLGRSAFDVRHNLVTNFTYDIPWSNLSGLSGRVLGGWQVGGIITIQSGTPFTAETGFNRSRDLARNITDRPNLKAGASNSPVLGGPDRYFDPTVFELPPAGFYGNLGRNTLTGPGFSNVDFTLAKVTSVNERLKVDFRAEFFNLFNHPNFALPRRQIFRTDGSLLGSAGRIQETIATGRQIQFGLKFVF